MGNHEEVRLENDSGKFTGSGLVGAGDRISKRKLITPPILEEMKRLYAMEYSCKTIGLMTGFCTVAVFKALKRNGVKVRSHKEVGPIQGAKRSGAAHWTKRTPPPCKPDTYKSARVVDEDGKVHKRRKHVIVMEQIIGRRLYAFECVHHIDGNKHNNDPSNLQLMTRSEHAKHEVRLMWDRLFPNGRSRHNGKFAKEAK